MKQEKEQEKESDKEYWFKLEGRIYAKDREDAQEQIDKMAIAGVNCERVFKELTEEEKEVSAEEEK